MVQNRKPPAYQEYAATMLASRGFRLMNIAERGLLFTIRLECWENKQVPASVNQLAKYIGCDVSEVQVAFTDRVKTFFHEKDDLLTCPELEDYRQHLAEIKSKQIAGGKKGAKKTNSKIGKSASELNAVGVNDSSELQVARQGSNGSLVQFSSVKQSQKQSLEAGCIDYSFIAEMNEYERGLKEG